MSIKFNDITKYYSNYKALDISECTIRAGAITGIIGPNGAGKSTLARILAGLDKADTGSIQYEGLLQAGDYNKKITMVFQKPYLLKTTVYKNIAYPLKIRGYDKKDIDSRVNNIINDMELQNIKYQKAWKLSGGEAQKAALARALIFNPSIVVLDEPTANIDPSSIAVMERMIRKAKEQLRSTIIIVTHNMHQAKRLCDDLIFMDKGKIVEKGESLQLIYDPRYETTKRFINGEL